MQTLADQSHSTHVMSTQLSYT